MICIVALVVFSILGIFSATNRKLAKEAFECIFKRITLRACETGFDEKVRVKILVKTAKLSPKLAKTINKNFEIFSWILFILMISSAIWTGYGLYNFYSYGSCNGLNQDGICVFDPTNSHNQISPVGLSCSKSTNKEDSLKIEGVDLSLFPSKKTDSENTIVFIGCYECDYSRQTYPIIEKLVEDKNANFTFAHLPAVGNTGYLSSVINCVNQISPEKVWQLNSTLFSLDKNLLEKKEEINGVIEELGIDKEKINSCLEKPETEELTAKQFQEVQKTNIYGTPTVFINGEAFVGPKPYRVYKKALK